MPTRPVTGGCQCGAVRYRLSALPKEPSVCHCRMCQKAGGAPFMVFAGLPDSHVEWTRGTPKIYASSDFAERGFCADCGTPLTYQMKGKPRISFSSGSFDHPEAIVPLDQLGVESRLPWVAALATLPVHKTEDWMRDMGVAAIHSRQHPDKEN